ncbi:hypothetical protein [Collimonas humicola]|uniref:hypothetical protein n=1 Tax=Collimonas humicola TaxID=2825886 RepID=UPI001B8C05C5|nr:hypothetical protein [Collimonas humicola]
MSDKSSKPGGPKYRFVVGVNLATFETDVNRLAADSPCLKLNQLLYVQGIGFIGVMENAADGNAAAGVETAKTEDPKKTGRRSPKEK